jgi:enoyl-CoA hydratase
MTIDPLQSDVVLVERFENGVVVLTLSRPEKMNALSFRLRADVTAAFRSLAIDTSVNAIVLTGSGRAFSAGVDLGELGSGKGASTLAATDLDMVGAMRSCSMPIIAAVNGVAITGGFELVLACDIVIAATKAQFADTHARVGIVATWGLTQRLPRLIGMNRAKELSFSGRFLTAPLAERWGLVTAVVEPDQLMNHSLALAEEIAAGDRAAVAAMKRCYDDGGDLPFGAALQFEIETAATHMRSVKPEDIAARRAAVQARGRAQSK